MFSYISSHCRSAISLFHMLTVVKKTEGFPSLRLSFFSQIIFLTGRFKSSSLEVFLPVDVSLSNTVTSFISGALLCNSTIHSVLLVEITLQLSRSEYYHEFHSLRSKQMLDKSFRFTVGPRRASQICARLMKCRGVWKIPDVLDSTCPPQTVRTCEAAAWFSPLVSRVSLGFVALQLKSMHKDWFS